MIILLIIALVTRHRRARRPAADGSNCITGKPCRLQCSLFCALEPEHHRAVTR